MKKLFENKIFKTIYSIFRAIVIIFLIVYLAFVIVQRVTNNADIFGYRMFTVATGSMEPVYMVNDVILVKKVDINTLVVGDDIAYVGATRENKGINITHRIVRIEKDSNGKTIYILKGVNNEYEDPAIHAEQILGKVRGKVPIINGLNHIVKNIYGFFFLVFCPLVLVLFLEIADTVVEVMVSKDELRLKEKKVVIKDEIDIEGNKVFNAVEGDKNEEEII